MGPCRLPLACSAPAHSGLHLPACSAPTRPALPVWLAVAGLAVDFTFTEIGGKARDVFKMFIS